MEEKKGNIGVFDSGLGGLWILKHLRERLPEYNYVFFADEAHMPYGDKTKEELFGYVTAILTYLFEQENCMGVILACNTVSSTIYDELRAWKDEHYFGRILFGIMRPTVESLSEHEPVAVFATPATCASSVYDEYLHSKTENILKVPMPELARLIEEGGDTYAYIESIKNKIPKEIENIHRGALLCTHYGIVKEDFKKAFPNITKWSYQEESIPLYLKNYFTEFPEREAFFARGGILKILTSKESDVLNRFAKEWFGGETKVEVVH